jgi:isopentenyl-diphosphate delta-isomerase
MASPFSSPSPPSSASAPGADALERVIVVDEHDRPLGTADKLEAHRDEGELHRAFSIFVFDAGGRMLLQQRSATKYHFPLLWTNACCSHPRPGESVAGAARRRAREELGVDLQPRAAFSFVYEARDEQTGLIEREFDHVMIARLDAAPEPNGDEIAALEWVDPRALLRDVETRPHRYTPWLRVAMPKLAARGLLATSD